MEIRKLTQEHKNKISQTLKRKYINGEITVPSTKGIKLSIEHRRKLSENAKNNPNYGMKGKIVSKETRKKMSLASFVK